jgi:hypothetical protein
MHKSPSKQVRLLDANRLLRVVSSPWWQLDANHRDEIAKYREPLNDIIAKLFDHDHQVRVVRHEEPDGGDTDIDEDRQNAEWRNSFLEPLVRRIDKD